MDSKPASILLLDAPSGDLDASIKKLEGYWKAQSIFILKRLSLPVLDGVAVLGRGGLRTAINLLRKKGWQEVLLRHDRSPEVPSYPMGGYIVPIGELRKDASKYFGAQRILILLEPYIAFDNSYNANVLFNDQNRIVVEVVGPGFDASDLQRRHISPHEIVEVDLGKLPSRLQEPFDLRVVERKFAIGTQSYRRSVKQRYLKIFGRLQDLGKIALPDDLSDDEKVRRAKDYLLSHKHDILARHESKYSPIPEGLLSEILGYLTGLPRKLKQYVDRDFPFVVSSSYVGNGKRLVFWDIVWAKLKYDLTNYGVVV